jgi:hypothetical protein
MAGPTDDATDHEGPTDEGLGAVAPAFVEMAHGIVWASVATVGEGGVPRSRVLHPIWEWDGTDMVGWVATAPTPLKRAHLEHSPWVSVNYWAPSQDTCTAECRATWHLDLPTRERVWRAFADGPEPVGYDPAIIPGWDAPDSDAFAVLRLDPWRLRVFPGGVLLGSGGEILAWSRPRG